MSLMIFSFTQFIVTFLVLGLTFFAVIWLLYDLRDRKVFDRQRQVDVYHCVKCQHLYTGKNFEELKKCPKCQRENIPLKF